VETVPAPVAEKFTAENEEEDLSTREARQKKHVDALALATCAIASVFSCPLRSL
jgi:hypothetical protein